MSEEPTSDVLAAVTRRSATAGPAFVPAARIAGRTYEGEPHDVPNPATGETLARVGWADVGEVDAAVAAARAAAAEWGATPPRTRAVALRGIAQTLRDNTDALAELISAESGKRLAEATGEVGFSAQYFDWFADATTQPRGEHYVNAARRFIVQRKPVGVVAAVSPWNFPLSIPARKVAPALGAGCPVVQKASELTPLTSVAFTELAEPHLPEGLLGVLVGDGEKLTTALIDHRDVAAVTFTGSTRVGAAVAERAMRTMTRVTMELGGKAPFVVCADADLDVALEALLVAKFRNNGASCIAANNVFIHESVYDEFVGRLRTRVGEITVADPADSASGLGPLLRPEHAERMDTLLALAEADGCSVTVGRYGPSHGWYAAPAVVEVRRDTAVWDEEIFGPICAVRPFASEDHVVAEVRSWRIGLGGYVMSADAEHAAALASRLDVGIVGINNGAPNTPEVPFGGIGYSGLGREGGIAGLLEFTEEQTLSFAR
ncbi:aldehyde dehydrogenase family protein [Solicola gregarius]|uniref:Aldehyde dehydrogenase family protein n=1 Tax=Solicola gregarius TaxID=2908642 RepID=A0AA46TG09_9ACTN|nr:aldehyde dehydrogenase family protein [Solicola gregarius]UYM04674.1 aldehyde dehydrogenase family protein [Solicola gregarius]